MKTFTEADLASIPVLLRITVEAGETAERAVGRACDMLHSGNASIQLALAMVGRPPPRYPGGPPYVTLGDDLEVPVVLRNVDWVALRQQKETLVRLASEGAISSGEAECLDGVVHLLDHLQDQAAEVLGEECVFGTYGVPSMAGQSYEITLRNKVRVTLPPGVSGVSQEGLTLLRQKAVEAFTALLAGDASNLDLLYLPVAADSSSGE